MVGIVLPSCVFFNHLTGARHSLQTNSSVLPSCFMMRRPMSIFSLPSPGMKLLKQVRSGVVALFTCTEVCTPGCFCPLTRETKFRSF